MNGENDDNKDSNIIRPCDEPSGIERPYESCGGVYKEKIHVVYGPHGKPIWWDDGWKPRKFELVLIKNKVELLNKEQIILRCKQCGQTWSPNIQPGGKLPRGYYKCPNRCNY